MTAVSISKQKSKISKTSLGTQKGAIIEPLQYHTEAKLVAQFSLYTGYYHSLIILLILIGVAYMAHGKSLKFEVKDSAIVPEESAENIKHDFEAISGFIFYSGALLFVSLGDIMMSNILGTSADSIANEKNIYQNVNKLRIWRNIYVFSLLFLVPLLVTGTEVFGCLFWLLFAFTFIRGSILVYICMLFREVKVAEQNIMMQEKQSAANLV